MYMLWIDGCVISVLMRCLFCVIVVSMSVFFSGCRLVLCDYGVI